MNSKIEEYEAICKVIDYIDENKRAKLLTDKGKLTVESVGGYLYKVTVHYAHGRELLLARKNLYIYLSEVIQELSIIS